MVRVKGTANITLLQPGDTRLPRAVFSPVMSGGASSFSRSLPSLSRPRSSSTAMRLHSRQTQCKICKLVVCKSNLARHRRHRHPEVHRAMVGPTFLRKPIMDSDSSTDSESASLSEVTLSTVNSPRCGQVPGSPPVKPVAAVSPECAHLDPSDIVPKTESPVCPKLVIKLPAVGEAISRNASKSKNFCSSPVNTQDLPPTPQTEEELHQGLMRLYTRKVHTEPQSTQISYSDTAVILHYSLVMNTRL